MPYNTKRRRSCFRDYATRSQERRSESIYFRWYRAHICFGKPVQARRRLKDFSVHIYIALNSLDFHARSGPEKQPFPLDSVSPCANNPNFLMAGQKILVLGGTGPAGICLLRELVYRKTPTIAFARNPSKLPADLSSNQYLQVCSMTHFIATS